MLVAEDNVVNQKLWQQICKRWHLTPIFAENGQEACEICERQRFDISLRELQMPKLNGFDATENINTNQQSLNRQTPIIALTADAFQETKNRVMTSGFTDYVGKPFKAEELRETILMNLKRRSETNRVDE